jgi:toxin CptA
MRLEQNGDVSLRSIVDNEYRVAQIMPGATVHPWLTVVRFECPEQPVQTLIVTVDSLKAADFRRLRVFLRWRAEISEMSDDA